MLLTDVFGLESLADFLTQGAEASDTPSAFDEGTYSAILGPLLASRTRRRCPTAPRSCRAALQGESVLVQGRILGADGQPMKDAILNVWDTAPNGLYEQQDPSQPEYNLRAPVPDRCGGPLRLPRLAPVRLSHPVRRPRRRSAETDGPASAIARRISTSASRAPGYKDLTTQMFERGGQYTA